MTAKVVAVGRDEFSKTACAYPWKSRRARKFVIGRYAGSEVRLGDVEYLILREDDVLGIIE